MRTGWRGDRLKSRVGGKSALGLLHAEVGHDFLRTTEDGGELGRAVKTFDYSAHARARDSATAEDLRALVGEEVGDAGAQKL